MQLDIDNPTVPDAFGLDNEQWDSYNRYEKALVALEFELQKSSAVSRMVETGPSQEVAVTFNLEPLGLNSGRLREDESAEEVLLRNLADAGILKEVLISDEVSINEIDVSDDNVQIIAAPSGY